MTSNAENDSPKNFVDLAFETRSQICEDLLEYTGHNASYHPLFQASPFSVYSMYWTDSKQIPPQLNEVSRDFSAVMSDAQHVSTLKPNAPVIVCNSTLLPRQFHRVHEAMNQAKAYDKQFRRREATLAASEVEITQEHLDMRKKWSLDHPVGIYRGQFPDGHQDVSATRMRDFLEYALPFVGELQQPLELCILVDTLRLTLALEEIKWSRYQPSRGLRQTEVRFRVTLLLIKSRGVVLVMKEVTQWMERYRGCGWRYATQQEIDLVSF
jgi:hypothetical protein